VPGFVIAFDSGALIAVQLTSPDIFQRQQPGRSTAATERQSERSGILPADEPAPVTAQFQPLDPNIVNEAIPAFYIGRNKEGFWCARDVKGRIGGIFLAKNSALSFARRHSQPVGCAAIFPSERIELDLENNGNPLVVPLRSLMRLTLRLRQFMIAFVSNITEALKRRLKVFHVL
jgi:hypothetical protein